MDYPQVPDLKVPCEICGSPVSAGQGSLPLNCPHCRRRLRPKTDSVWSHLSYVLFRRLFTWKGRATRKEFWSFTLPAWLLFIVCFPFWITFSAAIAFQDVVSGSFVRFVVISVSFLLPFILFGLPSAIITARRLHDISVSGKWALIHYVLSFCLFVTVLHSICYCVYDYFSMHDDAEMMEEVFYVVSDEYNLADCNTSLLEPYTLDYIESDECLESQVSRKMLSHPVSGFMFSLASFADVLLGLFLFAFMFVDSTKGINKYGPSRKYLHN